MHAGSCYLNTCGMVRGRYCIPERCVFLGVACKPSMMATGSSLSWFKSRKIRENLHLTSEIHFFEGNRANIWLIRGPGKDVIIDTGLGVQDLRHHLEVSDLVDPVEGERECSVICTHNHFDHSGGAHHFESVYIHEYDLPGLRNGQQTETLNYVKPAHFYRQPYRGFSACNYKVPATVCQPLKDGDQIDLGGGEHLEILHVPGHTKGSIAIYYPSKRELFTGDFVYECGSGATGYQIPLFKNTLIQLIG